MSLLVTLLSNNGSLMAESDSIHRDASFTMSGHEILASHDLPHEKIRGNPQYAVIESMNGLEISNRNIMGSNVIERDA